MFGWLLDLLGGSWWSYPLLVFLTGIDVVFPPLPSETAAITGGIVASRGGLWVPLVCFCCALGSFLGDNLGYWIGRRAQGFAQRWMLRGEKGRRRLDWAERTLERYGGSLVLVGRFVPGGRTATAVGCGALGFPYRLFLAYDIVGAATWGTVSTLLGYWGGETFSRRPLLAFAVAVGIAVLVAGIAEGARRLRASRRTSRAPVRSERTAQRGGSSS